MSPVEQIDLLETLVGQTASVADFWLQKLRGIITPPSNNAPDLADQMTSLVKQTISLLFSEPFDRHQAQTLGITLAQLWTNHPLILGQSQEILSSLLIKEIPANQAPILYNRLNGILAEMAVGFAQNPVENFKTHSLQNQQSLNSDLLNDEKFRKLLAENEEKLSELKKRFSTLISHEFRTPMARIMSASNLLKHYGSRLSDDRKQELLESIEEQVRDLERLLNDILLTSTIQAFGLKLTLSSFNPEQSCRQSITETLSKARIPESRVIFSAKNVCQEIIADEDLFQQIVSHLLTNAIVYSPAESKVDVTLHSDNNGLMIRVQSPGSRISETDLQRIFDPFYRGDDRGFIPGIGLGLTLVKYCVEAHQGTIRVESHETAGTSATVHFPLRPITI